MTTPIMEFGSFRLNLGEIPTKMVNVMAFGAMGDGVTDDTNAFRKAYAAIPASGGVLYIPKPPVRYRVSGKGATVTSPIVVVNITKNNVWILGAGLPEIHMDDFTLADTQANNELNGADIFTVFSFKNVKDGGVSGLKISGKADGVTSISLGKARAKGVGIDNSENIQVSHVTGYRIVGNTLNARGDTGYSSRISWIDCRAEGCSENGFNLMGGTRDCFVSNCYAEGCGFMGLESGCDRVAVTGCVFRNCKNGISHVGRWGTFVGCVLEGNRNSGFNFQYNNADPFNGSYNVVKGCVMRRNTQGVTGSGSAHDNLVEGCMILDNGSLAEGAGDGVKIMAGAAGYTILNNLIMDTGAGVQKYGVNAVTASKLVIRGNTLRGNTSNSILTQAGGDKHLIADNTIEKPLSLSGVATNVVNRNNDAQL